MFLIDRHTEITLHLFPFIFTKMSENRCDEAYLLSQHCQDLMGRSSLQCQSLLYTEIVSLNNYFLTETLF